MIPSRLFHCVQVRLRTALRGLLLGDNSGMTIAAISDSRDVDLIRHGVRDAADLTRWSLSQLSPSPMVALYQYISSNMVTTH